MAKGITEQEMDFATASGLVPHLGTTTNSSNEYSITTSVDVKPNTKFTLKINTASTGAPTLKINDKAAAPIKSSGDKDAKLHASVYTLFWDGSAFILQGEGGGGTAQPDDVSAGKTFTNDAGEQIGTSLKIYGPNDFLEVSQLGPIVSSRAWGNISVAVRHNALVAHNGYVYSASDAGVRKYDATTGELMTVFGSVYFTDIKLSYDKQSLFTVSREGAFYKLSFDLVIEAADTSGTVGSKICIAPSHAKYPGSVYVGTTSGQLTKFSAVGVKQWSKNRPYYGEVIRAMGFAGETMYIVGEGNEIVYMYPDESIGGGYSNISTTTAIITNPRNYKQALLFYYSRNTMQIWDDTTSKVMEVTLPKDLIQVSSVAVDPNDAAILYVVAQHENYVYRLNLDNSGSISEVVDISNGAGRNISVCADESSSVYVGAPTSTGLNKVIQRQKILR